MSAKHKTVKAGGKRHLSSSDDSSNSPITHGMMPQCETASSPDDDVVTPSEQAVTMNRAQVALVKKLKDSPNQQHQESPSTLRGRATTSCPASPKVACLELAMSPSAARRRHNAAIQPSQSSLLEDVLNEKKLALLQSPEVRLFLEEAQRSIAQNKRHAKTTEEVTQQSTSDGYAATLADSISLRHDDYSSDTETRDIWINSGNASVARADIWSKEASAFTSVIRPTNQ